VKFFVFLRFIGNSNIFLGNLFLHCAQKKNLQ